MSKICPRCNEREKRPGGATCHECLPGPSGDGEGRGTYTEEINRKATHGMSENRRKHQQREAAAKAAGRFV